MYNALYKFLRTAYRHWRIQRGRGFGGSAAPFLFVYMHLKTNKNFAQDALFLHKIITNFLGPKLHHYPSAPPLFIPKFWIRHCL